VLENLNTMQQQNLEAMKRMQAEQDRMAQLIDRMMKRLSKNPTPSEAALGGGAETDQEAESQDGDGDQTLQTVTLSCHPESQQHRPRRPARTQPAETPAASIVQAEGPDGIPAAPLRSWLSARRTHRAQPNPARLSCGSTWRFRLSGGSGT
jgi:hypothetical protein